MTWFAWLWAKAHVTFSYEGPNPHIYTSSVPMHGRIGLISKES